MQMRHLKNQKTSWEEFLSIQMLCWELWARVRVSNIMSNKTIQNIREKVWPLQGLIPLGPEILIPNFLTNLVKTARQIPNNNHSKLWPVNPHVLAKLFWQLSQNCGSSSALKIQTLFPFVSVIKYANLPIVQSFHYTTADTRQIHYAMSQPPSGTLFLFIWDKTSKHSTPNTVRSTEHNDWG